MNSNKIITNLKHTIGKRKQKIPRNKTNNQIINNTTFIEQDIVLTTQKLILRVVFRKR